MYLRARLRAIASEAIGVQIEAPSGISGMRRALLDAVEAGKNVQLNIDGAENSGYTEENGCVSNDGNRMDRGMLLEFDNCIGAGAVHEESKVISENAPDFALGEGDNIVLPIVGGNYEKLVAQIEQFRALGYDVAVHLCDLPSNKAIGRAIGRYLNTGRYIPMDILYGYGNKPKENFYRLVQEGIIHEYSEYSNDVGYGEPPRPIRQSAADTGGTGNQEYRAGSVAQDVRRSGRPSDAGASGESSQDARADGSYQRERNGESAGIQGEVHRPAEGQGAARRLTEPENKLAPYGAVQDGGDKGRSRVVENTLKNSPVLRALT